MEEFRESFMGTVVIFIIKVVVAIIMDSHEGEEFVSQENKVEHNTTIQYLLEDINEYKNNNK